MKNSLMLAASLATILTLTACPAPSGTSQPKPSGNPSATPSSKPSSDPSAMPSSDPGSSASPTPAVPTSTASPLPSALPTVTPPSNVETNLISASATKQPDFSYRFAINGTGLGALTDYDELQVQSSDATIKLVENGVIKTANVELKVAGAIAGDQVTFTWLPPNGAPTDNDMILITYDKKGDSPRVTTNVRLSVN